MQKSDSLFMNHHFPLDRTGGEAGEGGGGVTEVAEEKITKAEFLAGVIGHYIIHIMAYSRLKRDKLCETIQHVSKICKWPTLGLNFFFDNLILSDRTKFLRPWYPIAHFFFFFLAANV